MTLSGSTQAILTDTASAYPHGELTTLLKHAELGKNDPGATKPNGSWINKPTRVSEAFGKNPETEKLLSLATRMLNQKARGSEAPGWVDDLRKSLFKDGYDVVQSQESGTWSIGPLGAAEIPLPPQVSDLEASLRDKGFIVASEHYKQAFDAFKRQEWESANAATRTTTEGFLVEIAKSKFGYAGSSGGDAIEQLRQRDYFEQGEHDYLKGFWKMSHVNGSHPGLSNQEEALFRFSAATSALTFFIHRWAD